jgi:hypothetical protein
MSKKGKSIFLRNFGSLFYSLSITIGIYISLQELHVYQNINNFVIFSIALLYIYLIELYTTFLNKNRRIEINLNFNDDVNELSLLFHKIILPIVLYISIIGFGNYNLDSRIMPLILFITFFSFYILFLNTKAFLEKRVEIEHRTHYVYDIVKFLILFLSINTFSNAFRSTGSNLELYSILAGSANFLILGMMIWRIKKLKFSTLLYTLSSGVLMAGVFYMSNNIYRLSPLQISLCMVFLFYIIAAIIHHSIEGTLKKQVILEYITVIALVVAITYGIN